ncbi:hypothetical protein KIPB_011333, partial [Kipferlia bialata]|eukprot:g11333.t1
MYRRLQVTRVAKPDGAAASEARKWTSMKSKTIETPNSVTALAINPGADAEILCTTGTRVRLLSIPSFAFLRNVLSLRHSMQCAAFRADGGLIVSGDSVGSVRISNPANRSVLKRMDVHTSPVTAVGFVGYTPFSVGRDGSLVLWDMELG